MLTNIDTLCFFMALFSQARIAFKSFRTGEAPTGGDVFHTTAWLALAIGARIILG